MSPAPDARPNPIVYVLVILILGAVLLACLGMVVQSGFSGRGIVGIVGAIVATAVLLSYGRSMRVRKTTPIGR